MSNILIDEEKREAIRQAWAQGAKQKDLAQQFGVTQPYISQIVIGIPKVRKQPPQRCCVDCGAPVRHKTRCDNCSPAWRKHYSQQYYLKNKSGA